jgi:hypothetical protein
MTLREWLGHHRDQRLLPRISLLSTPETVVAVRRARERLADLEREVMPVDLDDLVARLQIAAARGDWSGISYRDRRDAPLCLWHGAPPFLAEDERILLALGRRSNWEEGDQGTYSCLPPPL